MPPCRLRVEKVCKSRPAPSGAQTHVLRDLSLDVPPAEMTLLIGPSGGGKSTLLRLINRLEEVDSGRILLDDTDIVSIDVLELRRRVCLVPQKPFMFAGSVLDNLLAPFRLRREEAPPPEYFTPLFDLCRIPSALAGREARTLSGGEQQRVALARALALAPSCLLLDEPTASLDRPTADELGNALKSICRKEGTTIMVATHDLRLAERLAGRVAFLEGGCLLEAGEGRAFFSAPRTEGLRRFLKTPDAEE